MSIEFGGGGLIDEAFVAHDAVYEVIRISVTTWPFAPREVDDRITRRLASGEWDRIFELDGFVVLERRRAKEE